MSIADQFDAFLKKATQHGDPVTKECAMMLGFYAGYVAALKRGNDLSHADASELETARKYEEMRVEMAEFFKEENIKSFYGKAVSKRANGKVKA